MPRLIDADKLPKFTGYVFSASEVAKAVENAPTVDAEPVRHGHWILREEPNGIDLHLECSECKEHQCGYNPEYGSKYCPNCGAKMDEEEK